MHRFTKHDWPPEVGVIFALRQRVFKGQESHYTLSLLPKYNLAWPVGPSEQSLLSALSLNTVSVAGL
jgi:hypothetical protein